MFYTKKNISNFCFTIIFILQISNTYCMNPSISKAGMSPEMWKMIGDVGLRALNNEKTKQAALAAAQNGSKLLAAANSFCGVTSCTYNIFTLGKDVKSYIAPTDEQKTHAIAVSEMLEFHKSKKELQHCLINNAHHERDTSGRPKACKNESHRFARAASDEALDEITTVFNNSYTE